MTSYRKQALVGFALTILYCITGFQTLVSVVSVILAPADITENLVLINSQT
jgi:hypothetical protein